MTAPLQLILDTTVLIDALRNRNRRRPWLAGLVLSGVELATSTMCIAEVYGGLRLGEEQATDAFFAGLEWIPVSGKIAERAGNLRAAFNRAGQTRSVANMIVAATALERAAPVATDNHKDFQVPGIALFPLP